MALVASSVAQVCKGLAQYLGGEFDGLDTKVHVLLGSPGDAATSEQDGEHNLNLFFFRFEPSGFDGDTLPGETQYLRMYCLATPFAVAEEAVSSGENDLRIIGEVLRVFQETPVFQLEADGEPFHLQVVFQTLGVEQINQLWATQGDTIYRPSVLFEVSLAPVIPQHRHVEPPRVGTLGLEVGGMAGGGTTTTAGATVTRMRPETGREDWAPAASLVHQGALVQSLTFAVGSDELAGFTPQVWVVGEPGTEVTLRWEVWDDQQGWQPHPGGTEVTLTEAAIHPEGLADASLHTVALPFDDRSGQLLLYAERSYPRATDGRTLLRRSNPLLITLYQEGA
ncbi:Pvc16 family protein [Alkalilimnicola ehrlichii MLHE-1]|uniref:Pvc16 N-terminal domain-containing protein n=1 Tax=Alkalilimnicola ehrlichii (strain ATCC BAA-1101 / DSM 17681 / MLHE-1) TaxID=187272 RepID=Q0A7T7_ALKEH|nr:Pvc16 family protein [Alkalilimnicola ehrlichii]ABI57100.1 conserved hypothetical protein [Alkalilimnicola ehrlichii MLHE-1]